MQLAARVLDGSKYLVNLSGVPVKWQSGSAVFTFSHFRVDTACQGFESKAMHRPKNTSHL